MGSRDDMPSHELTAEESSHRRAEIMRMRRQRLPWDQIGAAFDITRQRAYAIYRDALKEEPVAQLEEHRAEECHLIDKAVRELLAIALGEQEEVSPRTKVEAWNSLKGWSEWRGRLLGLPAPQQLSVTHHAETDFDRAFAELAAAMRGGSSGASKPVVDAEVVAELTAAADDRDR